VLFWPVTNANFGNTSYDEFANGHFLTKNMMKWFWDAYTTDPQELVIGFACQAMCLQLPWHSRR
jgi:acetyl esterase/lipase